LACEGLHDAAVVDVANETTRIAMMIAGRALFGLEAFRETDAIGDALTVALRWTDHAVVSLPITLQVELRLALLNACERSQRLRRHLGPLAARLEAPIMWPTRRNRELRRAIAFLDEQVHHMIQVRRAANDSRPDLLSRLLQARDEDDGGRMTDKQVRDEILTLFVAGHETTATGLAWALYLLARDPAAYAKARACVDALDGRVPTLADLGALGYLTRVFKEALRMYPPVFLFARLTVADVTIAGCELPARSIVAISPWALQRRADLWPDPERFDPERFTPAAEAARPRDAYIPFSDGPRVCIGAHFAQLEAPLVLATLLQHADFELASSAPIVPGAAPVSRPRGGVPMRVHRRSAPNQYQAIAETNAIRG
jgi:cytochrome P450